MSQYSHTVKVVNETTNESRVFGVVHGYDHPMQEYFIQVWDKNMPQEEADEDPIIWLGSRMTGTGRDEMYAVMKCFGVQDEYLQKLILDIPY